MSCVSEIRDYLVYRRTFENKVEFMALLSDISAPTEGVVCRQEKTTACIGSNDLGQGCVFVAER